MSAAATATVAQWKITGDYFENCNCTVVCPCVLAPPGMMQAAPTEGACEVPLAFHIERGAHGAVQLDGLNVVVALRTPGVMAHGNASVALYVDERADARQLEALTAIFSGAAGGPMGALAPLVSSVLGVKSVPITFTKEGKRRAVDVPGVMSLSVTATPGVDPDNEIWVSGAHPLFPDKLAMASGDVDSVYEDFGMRWDNSGKNGHYAPFTWSNG